MTMEATSWMGGKYVTISCHLHIGACPFGLSRVRIAPELLKPCAMSLATEGFSATTKTRGKLTSLPLPWQGRKTCFSTAGANGVCGVEEAGAGVFVVEGLFLVKVLWVVVVRFPGF